MSYGKRLSAWMDADDTDRRTVLVCMVVSVLITCVPLGLIGALLTCSWAPVLIVIAAAVLACPFIALAAWFTGWLG